MVARGWGSRAGEGLLLGMTPPAVGYDAVGVMEMFWTWREVLCSIVNVIPPMCIHENGKFYVI